MADDQAPQLAFLDQYRAQIKAVSSDPIAFQSYFNRCDSLEQARRNGMWDMACHLLVPEVAHNVNTGAVALEMGYGGGRLMSAACQMFDHVYGVDIHDSAEESARFIGADNFTLLRSENGYDIPLGTGTVDFAYSFIVLMHVRGMDTFRRILSEVSRALKPGGVAHLYYAAADHDCDVLEFPQNKPNEITLKIGAAQARLAFMAAGLSPIGEYRSMYRNLDGRYTGHGKQRSIVAVK